MKTRLTLMTAIISVALTSVFSIDISAQSRSFIREQIAQKGQCRNVAITRTNGDLMLYGTNGYAASSCPSDLTSALDELNEENEFIDDVQLTESGKWIILYGDNGFRWNDIPYGLESKIREYNSDNRVITSVTFNDAGDWIVIAKDYFSSSDESISQWLKEGLQEYGALWTACISEGSAIAVYEEGFKTLGEIPSTLKQALRNADFNVYRLKFAGEAWFISDGVSEYDYNM